MPFSDLSESQYLALGTWRKNGKVVDTTVWFDHNIILSIY